MFRLRWNIIVTAIENLQRDKENERGAENRKSVEKKAVTVWQHERVNPC